MLFANISALQHHTHRLCAPQNFLQVAQDRDYVHTVAPSAVAQAFDAALHHYASAPTPDHRWAVARWLHVAHQCEHVQLAPPGTVVYEVGRDHHATFAALHPHSAADFLNARLLIHRDSIGIGAPANAHDFLGMLALMYRNEHVATGPIVIKYNPIPSLDALWPTPARTASALQPALIYGEFTAFDGLVALAAGCHFIGVGAAPNRIHGAPSSRLALTVHDRLHYTWRSNPARRHDLQTLQHHLRVALLSIPRDALEAIADPIYTASELLTNGSLHFASADYFLGISLCELEAWQLRAISPYLPAFRNAVAALDHRANAA